LFFIYINTTILKVFLENTYTLQTILEKRIIMKGLITILLMLTSLIMAQNDGVKVYKSGLYLGASGVYPHYMTITDKSIATHKNVGFSFHMGWDMTEHFGFRVSPHYLLLNSFYYRGGEEQDNHVNMATVNIDAIYNILPCEIISPYIIVGFGFNWFKSSNPYLGPNGNRHWIKNSFTGNQFELGLGAEFKFWDDLSIKVESDYVTATNNKIDGNEHTNEVKGILQSNGDAYLNLSIGASWYFWRGEKSKICEPFSIREVIKEVVVEKVIIDTVYIRDAIVGAVQQQKAFVLDKVRFKFDKDVLTREAEIILDNVVNVFQEYPQYEFEIIGHTDSWGSDEYNMDLSERRAIAVKKYLVNHGVDSTRLYTAGCGERKPIADNETSEGRAINRRIEFSIYDGVSSKCPKVGENVELEDDAIGVDFTNNEEKNIAKALLSGEQLSFTNVRFKHDSDELTEPSKEILDNVVNVLNKLPDLKLEVQGHTDSDGSDVYNQNLSQRRAESVKEYLVSNGTNKDRLTTAGFGESTPVSDNDTTEGKALNRRIEFKVIK
jgi:outer membrane protein OmpA-like peptidoglycan-associated protein/opacity protein-like surface antigen